VSADLFAESEGATPLDPDDAKGLIPTWVATRGDLNAVEAGNIASAVRWAFTSPRMNSRETLMTSDSMQMLHRRMFGEVWRWAGHYRTHDTNIGTPWAYILTRVHELVADVMAQTADTGDLPWPPDELAIRFHHRLVSIHPFPNGNGRHARLAADLLVGTLGELPFSWGAQDLGQDSEARAAYLLALRTADATFDYAPLVEFARS